MALLGTDFSRITIHPIRASFCLHHDIQFAPTDVFPSTLSHPICGWQHLLSASTTFLSFNKVAPVSRRPRTTTSFGHDAPPMDNCVDFFMTSLQGSSGTFWFYLMYAFCLFLEKISPTRQHSSETEYSYKFAGRNSFVKLTQSRLLPTLFGQPSLSLTTNLKASPTLPNSKKMQDAKRAGSCSL